MFRLIYQDVAASVRHEVTKSGRGLVHYQELWNFRAAIAARRIVTFR
jgi:hypothetical protein